MIVMIVMAATIRSKSEGMIYYHYLLSHAPSSLLSPLVLDALLPVTHQLVIMIRVRGERGEGRGEGREGRGERGEGTDERGERRGERGEKERGEKEGRGGERNVSGEWALRIVGWAHKSKLV